MGKENLDIELQTFWPHSFLNNSFQCKNMWKGSGRRKKEFYPSLVFTLTTDSSLLMALQILCLQCSCSWMPSALCLISFLSSYISQIRFPKTQIDFVTWTVFTKLVWVKTSIKTTKQLSSILRFLKMFPVLILSSIFSLFFELKNHQYFKTNKQKKTQNKTDKHIRKKPKPNLWKFHVFSDLRNLTS